MRRRILITGASAGLGRGMAWEFARRGRDLALCARRQNLLEELRDELLAEYPGISVSVRTLDVTDHPAVFKVFGEFAAEPGGLDRIVVNAGSSRGRPVGTGEFELNRRTAETNFTAVLAQCEAALEIFRARGAGHLVLISSVCALRAFPQNLTTYAASKAAVLALGEGMRADLMGTPIAVTTLLPGYIRSETQTAQGPLVADFERGCRALAKVIEHEPARACVPAWPPWWLFGLGMRVLPLRIVSRFGGTAQRSRVALTDSAGAAP
ncbi:SDR family oxidoreductase [Amycolatopsis sp. NPDC059027]|uniref:SDR family oxidoreductase n=1 Tax=unclassified Amycolatopsis TaxID=2618356 RepID=UPI003671AE6C